jgi:hypothetical protein
MAFLLNQTNHANELSTVEKKGGETNKNKQTIEKNESKWIAISGFCDGQNEF